MAITVLTESLDFPDPRSATRDGLVAIGGDLSVKRLLQAYRSGLFPWTADPITWWSPDPRAIFELERFHVPRSLARELRKSDFRVSRDEAFRKVIEMCAAPAANRPDTWIGPEFIKSYCQLHKIGHAHSVECWCGPELVGGIYGVAVGGLFAAESMFHRADNASKVALVHLVHHLRERGFALFDIQMVTPATQQLGATTIARDEYLQRLTRAVRLDCVF